VSLSAFPWPGGKNNYIDEIVRYFPTHRRYVEPFGGSAALLLNKPESYIEVYNDIDSDVVHFFRVARENPVELIDWLRHTPFSRELHEQWGREFFDGYRPNDDVERAGRWFFLRYTQYGGKLNGISGFKASGVRNEARSFVGAIDDLERVVERFRDVTIECEDYAAVIDRYDAPDTLFYLDPPYVDRERYYNHGEFDHYELAETLADVDGYWVCSYGDLPKSLAPLSTTVESFDATYSLHYTADEGRREATERLAMNFDPQEVPRFHTSDQQTLGEVARAD
jgi:DNA adenine methylase